MGHRTEFRSPDGDPVLPLVQPPGPSSNPSRRDQSELLLPLALVAADAPLPPYYATLLDLHAEVPNLSLSRPVDPATLSDRARALLHDLRLVQYDFSVGERYATEEMFHPSP